MEFSLTLSISQILFADGKQSQFFLEFRDAFPAYRDHEHVLDAGQWKQSFQGYLASITFCGAMLGRLLDELENSSYAENTIIVPWSDHGRQLGEKEHWRKFALWKNIGTSLSNKYNDDNKQTKIH